MLHKCGIIDLTRSWTGMPPVFVRLDDEVVAAVVVEWTGETFARAIALVVGAVVARVVGADDVAGVVVTVVAGGRDEACAPTLQLGILAFRMLETTSCSPLPNEMAGRDLCTPDLGNHIRWSLAPLDWFSACQEASNLPEQFQLRSSPCRR